ncbi:lipopolysaccharide biosynthesis protein [Vibrio sp. FJH11]
MSNLKNKVVHGAIWTLLDKLFNQAGSFVLLIYLSRVLSPSDFGMIAMLAIFLAVSQSLIDSGFSQALIQKSKRVTDEDLSTVFYINLLLSILLYFFLYISSPYISSFYNQPELTNLSRVLFIIIIINAIAVVPRTKLLIAMNFRIQGLINSISMLVSATVAIYMISNEFGYWTLVGMNLTKSMVSTILLVSYSRWRPKWLFSEESFKTLFSFGSNLLIAGLLATVVQNLYSILIGRYFNATQVGYYQQGYKFTNILSSTISSTIQGVTYPAMTSIQEEEQRLVQIYIKVMGIVTLLTLPIFVGFAAISEEFVLIFLGEKWEEIIPILIILSMARAFTPISALNLNILNARGRSDLFLKADLIKLPVSILALIIAIPHGIVAVAMSQLGFTIISFFINTYYPGKLFGFGAKEQIKQILPTIIASFIMFLSIIFIKLDSIEIEIIVKIIVGVVVYILACWFLKIPAFIDVFNIALRRLKAET